MDEKIGLGLIGKLKEDPEKFQKEGGAYQLLQEYFDGLSRETLRGLLCCKDKRIRQTALWILSELGGEAGAFLKEAAVLMNDDDPLICYYAAEIVACYAVDEYMDDFMRVFGLFEHSNPKIRTLSMFILSRLSDSRIQEAYTYLVNSRIPGGSHEKGLLSLINVNTLTHSDITSMLDSADGIIRKYGIIAASRVYEKYPELVEKSVDSTDSDVRDFAKDEMLARAEISLRKSKLRGK